MSDTRASRQVLVVEVAGRRLAVPLSRVREAHQAVATTEFPAATDAIVGAVDLRGIVVPVVDARIALGLPALESTVDAVMLVCETSHGPAMLLVEGVVDIATLEDAEQDTAAWDRPWDLRGRLARIPEGLLAVLDVDSLLASDASVL